MGITTRITDHDFLPVNGHSDDDECTYARTVPMRRTAVSRNDCTATTSAPTGRRAIRVGDQSIERPAKGDSYGRDMFGNREVGNEGF